MVFAGISTKKFSKTLCALYPSPHHPGFKENQDFPNVFSGCQLSSSSSSSIDSSSSPRLIVEFHTFIMFSSPFLSAQIVFCVLLYIYIYIYRSLSLDVRSSYHTQPTHLQFISPIIFSSHQSDRHFHPALFLLLFFLSFCPLIHLVLTSFALLSSPFPRDSLVARTLPKCIF